MKRVFEFVLFFAFIFVTFGIFMSFVLAQDTNMTDTNTTQNNTNQNMTANVTQNTTSATNHTNTTVPPTNTTETDDDQNETEDDNESNDNDDDNESQQNDNDDNETDDDTNEMQTRHGAEMRLFQLQRRINFAILHMEAVIDVVKNKSNVTNASSITELESIVAETKLLLDEAKNISPVNTDEAVQRFVEVKKDAITLIHKFRKIAKDLLGPEDKRALKEMFKQIEKDEFKELKEKIHEKRKMLNAERSREMLRHMGVTDEEFLRNIEGGKITAHEIRIKLRERFEDVDEDKRDEIKKELREEFEDEKEMHEKRLMKAREIEHRENAQRMMKRAEKIKHMEENEDSREGSNRGGR